MSYSPELFQNVISFIREKGVWIDPDSFSKFKKIGDTAFLTYMKIQNEYVFLSFLAKT